MAASAPASAPASRDGMEPAGRDTEAGTYHALAVCGYAFGQNLEANFIETLFDASGRPLEQEHIEIRHGAWTSRGWDLLLLVAYSTWTLNARDVANGEMGLARLVGHDRETSPYIGKTSPQLLLDVLTSLQEMADVENTWHRSVRTLSWHRARPRFTGSQA